MAIRAAPTSANAAGAAGFVASPVGGSAAAASVGAVFFGAGVAAAGLAVGVVGVSGVVHSMRSTWTATSRAFPAGATTAAPSTVRGAVRKALKATLSVAEGVTLLDAHPFLWVTQTYLGFDLPRAR